MSCFSPVVIKLLVLAFHIQVGKCLDFSFLNFPHQIYPDLILSANASIGVNAIEVTGVPISNLSGRVCYHRQFKLWSKHKNVTASFTSTFVLHITPQNSPTGGVLHITPQNSPTGGEGMAFLLAADCSVPDNSHGKWLGIVNASTNNVSTRTQTNVVAVEFDTNKSYPEDVDGNHVGVDVNSIFSMLQVSLTRHSVNLSGGEAITASIRYDGVSKVIEIFVNATASESMMKNKNISPIISMPLDLSKHLPESVFVGFSASTGEKTEFNCLKSWNFTSTNIDDEDPNFLLWIGISVPAIAIVLSIGVITCIYRKRKRQKEEKDAEIEQEIQNSATGHPQKFKLKELKLATQNFSPKNELGEGGFGRVYKGILNSKEVAVKRLISKNPGHGKQEFIAEVTTIGSLHHKNLVKLLGWCYERNELLLVYEFMPKGSLDKLIFGNERPPPLLGIEKGSDSNSTILSWQTRHGIICGVAEALDYLHNGCEKRVLHRDIKASNIMLDSEFNPRLGDFGLARTFHLSEKTHHSTKEIAGTLGYMAPEIFHTGRASVETDVYAFGVLLLEVSCGRKPGEQDEHNNYINRIVEWVWELHRRKEINRAIDFRLYGGFAEEEAECVLLLGLACCHPNPYQRPSMKTVLQVLIGEIAPPLVPLERPPFMWPAAAAAISPSFKEHLDYSNISGLSDIITGR